MILNVEREAMVKDLIVELHNFARKTEDDEARDLADCIDHMYKLWKADRRSQRERSH